MFKSEQIFIESDKLIFRPWSSTLRAGDAWKRSLQDEDIGAMQAAPCKQRQEGSAKQRVPGRGRQADSAKEVRGRFQREAALYAKKDKGCFREALGASTRRALLVLFSSCLREALGGIGLRICSLWLRNVAGCCRVRRFQ